MQSMCAWTNNIHELVHKITKLSGIVLDEDLIVVLTNNLPESYQPLIVSLELVEESKLTTDYIINCLVNEEDQQGREQPEKQLALEARAKPKTPKSQIMCWNCNKRGHYSIECPDSEDGDKKNGKNIQDGKDSQYTRIKQTGGSLY